MQGTKLIKHVHQKLTMSCLNGHDSIQYTANVWINRGRRWRNSSSRINRLLSNSITCRRGRRRCDIGILNPMTFRAGSHLSSLLPKKVALIRAIIWTGSDAVNSSKPRCNKIWWIKMGKKRACAIELLLWSSIKEWMKRWGKFIGALETRAYKNAQRLIGIVCKWEIGQMEWQEI